MRQHRRALSLFLVFALLLNLFLPMSLVSAANGANGIVDCTSVTDDAYAEEPEPCTEEEQQELPSVGLLDEIELVAASQKIEENIITDVTLYEEKSGNSIPIDANIYPDNRPSISSKIKLRYDYELDEWHPYGAGSTYSFTPPKPHIVLDEVLEGILEGATGSVGTFTVAQDGTVTLVFNEKIRSELDLGLNVTGYVEVWGSFNQGSFNNETKHELNFTHPHKTIPIHFDPGFTDTLTKNGAREKQKNPNYIDWEVDFNLLEDRIGNVEVVDTLPNGLEVDITTVEVYKLKVGLDQSKAEVTPALVEGSDYDVNWNPTTRELTFSRFENPLDSAYRIKYQTKVTERNPETTEFENNVTVTGNNGEYSKADSAKVDVQFSQPLSKSSTRAGYDSDEGEQTISWEIRYNFNQQEIAHEIAKLHDIFPNTEELIENTFKVKKVTIDDSDNIIDEVSILERDTDYTLTLTPNPAPNKAGFELQFISDISEPYVITYKTKSKDRLGHEDDSRTVTNEVWETEKEDKKVSASQRISQQILTKSNSINYNTREITWTITINRDNQTMNNLVVRDEFKDQGLTYKDGSMTVNDQSVTPPALTVDDDNQGFSLELGNVIDAQEIKYTTTFDPTSAQRPSTYRNDVRIDWEVSDDTSRSKITHSTRTPNPYTTQNGDKYGQYDATTKRITWTIDFNYNHHTIAEPKIVDQYQGAQKLIKESLAVYELNINANGSGNRPVSRGEKLVLDTDYFVSYDDANQEFEITFAPPHLPMKTAYQVQYDTDIAGNHIVAEYENSAQLLDGSTTLSTFNNRKVEVEHGGEYVHKQAVSQLGRNLKWQIDINRNQSNLEDVKLIDTVVGPQMLMESSFKLYSTTISPIGTVSKNTLIDKDSGFYTLVIDQDKMGFTLDIHGTINSAYILEYESFITGKYNDEIDNTVEFRAEGHQESGLSKPISWTVINSGGLGTGDVGSGTLKVKKVDANNSAETLEGAKFELYYVQGNIHITTFETDSDGLATINGLPYGNYKLVEIEAPQGYVATEVETTIILNAATSNREIEIKNDKITRGFEFTKVDNSDPNKKLAGAEFDLLFDDGTGYKKIDTLISNSDGIIAKSNLDPGRYQLIETKAPTGYILNGTSTTFEITANQIEMEIGNITNEIATGGSVKLTKKDKHTEQKLVGAQFKLEYNQGSTGTWVQVGPIYTTDINGEIEVPNLDGGEYRFVEEVAPTGYEQDLTPLEFELVSGDMHKEVTFTNEITPRSIILNKLGDNGEKLAGAVFELQYDSGQRAKNIDGQEIPNQTTDQNGTLTFDNLRPGNYQLVEIAPPKGYKLDATPIEVDIDQETIQQTITINNSLVDDGSITIIKVDEDYNELVLAGAVFQIIDLATDDIARDKDGKLLDKLTTDADGKLTVTNLKTGKYRVVEVEAPEGYHLGNQDFEFEIDREGQIVQHTFKNKIILGSVTLTKIRKGYPDSKLKGAEFTLYNEHGEIVKDQNGKELTGLTTDDNGLLVISNLRPGTYYFLETKAPAGYRQSTEKIIFTITKGNGEAPSTEIIVENERRPSGGGGGGGGGYYPPEEEPENPVDPNTPEEEEQLDPNESEEPTTTEDSNTPEEEQQTTTEDPNTPTNQGQSGQGAGDDQQGSDHTTGNLSDNASENLPSAQDQQMNNDSRNLADSDSNAAANKKLLPQTGESLPFTTFLGLLLIIAAALILFRKESVQNK